MGGGRRKLDTSAHEKRLWNAARQIRYIYITSGLLWKPLSNLVRRPGCFCLSHPAAKVTEENLDGSGFPAWTTLLGKAHCGRSADQSEFVRTCQGHCLDAATGSF